MPLKQNAYQQLKAILEIHKCLRTGNEVSGEELAKVCRIDKRTVISYVAFMRKKFKASILSSRYYGYKYDQKKPFSILSILEDTELGTLNELLAMVRQLQKTKELRGMERILLALERQVGIVKSNPNPLIEFEEAELVGRQYLDKLYQLTNEKKFVKLSYQGFDMTEPVTKILFPVQIREYNNRWYLIGWGELNEEIILQNIAIDRIQGEPGETSITFSYPNDFDLAAHFKNLIGMTKTGDLQTVRLKFHDRKRVNYAITKKIHHSQESPIYNEDGTVELIIKVEINKELIAKILEFGADVEVLEPQTLRDEIAAIVQKAMLMYQ